MRRNAQTSTGHSKSPEPDEKISNVDEIMALRRSLLHASQDLLKFERNERDALAICRALKALLRFFRRQDRIACDLETSAARIEDEIDTALEVGDVHVEAISEDVAALVKDLSIRLVDWHYRPSSLAQVRALTTGLQQAGVAICCIPDTSVQAAC